jgi:vacuolar protein 8
MITSVDPRQRGDADFDFYSGDPLRALSTLVYSGSVELQRSAALTFAEITDRGASNDAMPPLSLPTNDHISSILI